MQRLFKILNLKNAVPIISVFLGIWLFAVFVGGAIPVMLKSYEDKNQVISSKYLDEADRIASDVMKTLDKLNAQKLEPCSDEMIKQMRFAQFEATFVKDVGFSSDNQLWCTSGLGKLEKPFKEVPPQVVTPDGSSLWIDVPIKLFNFEKKANVLKNRHFNAVFNISTVERSELNGKGLAVYFIQKKGEPYFYAGNADIPLYSARNHSHFSLKGMTTIKCSKRSAMCTAVYISYADIARKERAMLFGIIMLSALSTIFISKFFHDQLKKFKGFENRFRYGFNKDRILCYYQPIVEMDTGIIIGCEVLCRWTDYDGSVVSPDKFLHIVRAMNKTQEFTQIIIDKTFYELAYTIRKHRHVRISFNIFPCDFSKDKIEKMVGNYKHVYPDIKINLELTEDELVELSKVSQCIDELRAEGYVISIDDFGTGYSSLSYLRDINADYIKIDRSFVKEIEHGSIKSNLIPYIVAIAADTGSQVIAEGIENMDQINYLMYYDVKYGQGYYYSKPCPAEEFQNLFCGTKIC